MANRFRLLLADSSALSSVFFYSLELTPLITYQHNRPIGAAGIHTRPLEAGVFRTARSILSSILTPPRRISTYHNTCCNCLITSNIVPVLLFHVLKFVPLAALSHFAFRLHVRSVRHANKIWDEEPRNNNLYPGQQLYILVRNYFFFVNLKASFTILLLTLNTWISS